VTAAFAPETYPDLALRIKDPYPKPLKSHGFNTSILKGSAKIMGKDVYANTCQRFSAAIWM
jgi:hypothetical protein